MQTLVYNGSWFKAFLGWNGELVVVEDATGKYSRHSHFVQQVKRFLGKDYRVWSRKKTCYAMTANDSKMTANTLVG